MSEAKPKGISTSLVVAVIVALIIGVVAGYFIKPTAPAEVKTETVIKTETKTIEKTIEKTVTATPLVIGPYPTEEEMLTSLKSAKINWRQYEGTSITFIGNREPNQEAIGKLVPIFEKLTGIKVTYELVEEEELRTKTTLDIVGKTGLYDALLIDPMFISKFVEAGGLEDLSKYLYNTKLTDLEWYGWPDDFPKGFRDMGSYKGVVYGIPLHLSGTLLFWNKEYFKKYGLDPNRPPKTMDELVKYAAKCHHPEDGVYGIAMRGVRGSGLNIFIWSCFLKSFGGKWFDEKWRPLLNSTEALNAVKFYADILRKYGPPGVSTYEWSKILALMQEGKVAIVIDTPAFGISIEDPSKSKTAGQWGYAAQPAGPAGICMDPYSWYVGINSFSKKKEAAWLFIQWLTSKEVQMKIGGPAMYVSRLSVNNDVRWQKYFPWLKEWQSALMENVKYADPDCRVRIPEWPEIGDIAGAALESVIAGEKTPEDAFNEACARIYEVMKKAGYYG